MSSLDHKRSRASRCAAIVVVAAVVAVPLMTGNASALQDQLKGGVVNFQVHKLKGLKVKPRGLSLPITSGAVDPADGSGSAFVTGGFRAKRGKLKTKVKLQSFTFGAHGGSGSVSAQVGKQFVSNFGHLSGGTVTRAGWGARIENVTATLSRKGARALNKAFSPKRKKKGARKSGKRRTKGKVKLKAGKPLGTIVSATTDPLTVQVVPGKGELVLHTNAMGSFVSKLPAHCIDPLPTGSPTGVAPISPATTSGLLGTNYHFPVSGGDVAPDFSAGELITAGGQVLTKNHSSNPLNPSRCNSAQPPVGTKLLSTDLSVAFTQRLMRSIPTLPTGPAPRAPLATIDFSTGSRSIDPNTRSLTVTGATVRLADIAATTLNQVFPTESGSSGDDFATGDSIGTIDLVGVKLQ
jgi:hypothetical protein